uniref:Uncharacterized protein n=1 Tax=Arundo donax TaxID=35708 RepID=A0A0A8ZEC1_ARUDO
MYGLDRLPGLLRLSSSPPACRSSP